MWECSPQFVIACVAAAIRALWDAISNHLELACDAQSRKVITDTIEKVFDIVCTGLHALVCSVCTAGYPCRSVTAQGEARG